MQFQLQQGPAQVLLRKHSKQSLSQPTIPEEEHEDQPEALEQPVAAAVAKPQVVKNLYPELTSSGGAVSKNSRATAAAKASPEPEPKSPKVSRHESMERTVQRITKAIRGSGRSDSKSKKKEREASPSPSKKEVASQKVSRKDSQKKNAQEKREIFKSLH